MRRSVILFVLLLLPTFVYGDDLSGLLPVKVGELVRVQLVVGAEAQAEVNRLHGKMVSAEASAIGRYARPDAAERPAEVWISRVASEIEARRQTGLMVHKMFENPQSPFKHPRRIEENGLSVYRFTGMGQVHLIWSKEDRVYWISAGPEAVVAMMDVFCR